MLHTYTFTYADAHACINICICKYMDMSAFSPIAIYIYMYIYRCTWCGAILHHAEISWKQYFRVTYPNKTGLALFNTMNEIYNSWWPKQHIRVRVLYPGYPSTVKAKQNRANLRTNVNISLHDCHRPLRRLARLAAHLLQPAPVNQHLRSILSVSPESRS